MIFLLLSHALIAEPFLQDLLPADIQFGIKWDDISARYSHLEKSESSARGFDSVVFDATNQFSFPEVIQKGAFTVARIVFPHETREICEVSLFLIYPRHGFSYSAKEKREKEMMAQVALLEKKYKLNVVYENEYSSNRYYGFSSNREREISLYAGTKEILTEEAHAQLEITFRKYPTEFWTLTNQDVPEDLKIGENWNELSKKYKNQIVEQGYKGELISISVDLAKGSSVASGYGIQKTIELKLDDNRRIVELRMKNSINNADNNEGLLQEWKENFKTVAEKYKKSHSLKEKEDFNSSLISKNKDVTLEWEKSRGCLITELYMIEKIYDKGIWDFFTDRELEDIQIDLSWNQLEKKYKNKIVNTQNYSSGKPFSIDLDLLKENPVAKKYGTQILLQIELDEAGKIIQIARYESYNTDLLPAEFFEKLSEEFQKMAQEYENRYGLMKVLDSFYSYDVKSKFNGRNVWLRKSSTSPFDHIERYKFYIGERNFSDIITDFNDRISLCEKMDW